MDECDARKAMWDLIVLMTTRAVDGCATHTGQRGSCRGMECTTASSGKGAKGHGWDHEGDEK